MKKVLLGFLFGGLLALAPAAQAQTDVSATITYSEVVPAEGAGRLALYRRALDWTQNHFSYGPKSGVKADEQTGLIKLTGTSRVKQVDSKGREQEVTVLFDFTFRGNDNGYTYSVDNLRVMPDAKQPNQIISFDEHRAELRADKSNDRTHNDRRITAQATSLASEASMAFRSYMNSTPAEGQVGIAGGEN